MQVFRVIIVLMRHVRSECLIYSRHGHQILWQDNFLERSLAIFLCASSKETKQRDKIRLCIGDVWLGRDSSHCEGWENRIYYFAISKRWSISCSAQSDSSQERKSCRG